MNQHDEPEEHRVGAHTVRFVPPDVVVVTLVGSIEPSDLRGLHGRLEVMKPLTFVETEAEGHAFINQCRRALEAKATRAADRVADSSRSINRVSWTS